RDAPGRREAFVDEALQRGNEPVEVAAELHAGIVDADDGRRRLVLEGDPVRLSARHGWFSGGGCRTSQHPGCARWKLPGRGHPQQIRPVARAVAGAMRGECVAAAYCSVAAASQSFTASSARSRLSLFSCCLNTASWASAEVP